MKTTTQLNKEALQLYDGKATAKDFANHFSRKELKELWDNFCIYKRDKTGQLKGVAAYDDEVYDALWIENYWQTLIHWEEGII